MATESTNVIISFDSGLISLLADDEIVPLMVGFEDYREIWSFSKFSVVVPEDGII